MRMQDTLLSTILLDGDIHSFPSAATKFARKLQVQQLRVASPSWGFLLGITYPYNAILAGTPCTKWLQPSPLHIGTQVGTYLGTGT